VSFVLNNRPGLSIPEETRRRVLDAARRLDYHPHASARALAAGRSDIVLLSIPDLPIGQGISRFVEELAAALAEHGLTLVTHLAGRNGKPLPDVCAAVGASAVTGLEPLGAEMVDALHAAGASVVLFQSDEEGSVMRSVGRIQAEHLIELGHRRLGYVLSSDDALRRMGEERLLGTTAACAAAELEPPAVVTAGLEVDEAASAVERLRTLSVTGVCAFNDETAIAVLAGLREHGLQAPGDIAVIGADDIPTAAVATPPLTSVRFNLPQAGRRRAEAIVDALANRAKTPPPQGVGADLQLVRRAST
jgi:DNA-binding LacI/PurR family transcriptional regulator